VRHGVSGRKLNRTTSHRSAMFRNMVTSLLQHERIYTTLPKAKELRRWADWMITLGKRGDLHGRRQALATIRVKSTVHKLFEELAPRYQNRQGGYTRIVKVGFRRGDASPMCLIELVTDAKAPQRKGRQKVTAPVKTKPAEETSHMAIAKKSEENTG
jgi:large subunit ribosomal protein L17